MTQTELLEDQLSKNIKGLPNEILQEVLDFVLFLKEKRLSELLINDIEKELRNLDKNELLHLEKEFENYEEM
ncbi:MAG: DUF2281 domain-containing protein [Candidatus Sericytochromatia bacterium]|nr:DUF2281 domain-containing protein [Candidatus Sericytochromatia bacterium]